MSFCRVCGNDSIGGRVVAAFRTLGFQVLVCSTYDAKVVFVASVALLRSEGSTNRFRGGHGVEVHCIRGRTGKRSRRRRACGRNRVKLVVRALGLRCWCSILSFLELAFAPSVVATNG